MNVDPGGAQRRPERSAWNQPSMRRALADRDLASVFRLLGKIGFSQRAIATSAGLSPSEVYEILKGRRVMAYDVLCRVADGLGVPRGHLGLAYDAETASLIAGISAAVEPSTERAQVHLLLAHAAEVTMGVDSREAEPRLQPPRDAATPIPSRIGAVDITQIENVTAGLRSLDYQYGGGACREAVLSQTRWVGRLLHSEATDEVRHRLHITLADLHNLAGWTSFDMGLHPAARYHFAQAISQSREAREPSLLANVLYRTGRLHLHSGLTNEALRFFQLGQIAAQDAGDPWAVSVLCANEAWAYSILGDVSQTIRSLHRAADELGRADLATAAPWVRFFGPTDLRALTGMAYLALSDLDSCHLAAAREALDETLRSRANTMARSQAFELTALAFALFREGDQHTGVQIGFKAVVLAEHLRSARVVDRLAPLEQEASLSKLGEAGDLVRRIAELRSA